MMLGVKEVSRFFAVSEKTIYRWIAKNEIPSYKIGECYRFNRVDLLEWATSRKMPVSPEIFQEPQDTTVSQPSLVEALSTGGIHYRISGIDKESVINSIVDIIPLPEDVDKKFLSSALIARENMGTTAVGNGIAIPHVRNPIIYHITKPFVALCFLEQGIEFGALDKKPVDIMFTIITNSIRSHLHLLSRLSFALHKPEIRKIIRSESTREQIVEVFTSLETTLDAQVVR